MFGLIMTNILVSERPYFWNWIDIGKISQHACFIWAGIKKNYHQGIPLILQNNFTGYKTNY